MVQPKLKAAAIVLLLLTPALAIEHHAKTVVSPYFKFDAEQPLRVAVLPFAIAGDGTDATLAEITSTELMKAGFRVVERDRIEDVLKELKLNLSGVIESRQYKELGKWLAADLIVTGSENRSLGAFAVKMTDVQTGEVMISSFLDSVGMKATETPALVVASIKRVLLKQPDSQDLIVQATPEKTLVSMLEGFKSKAPVTIRFKNGRVENLAFVSRQIGGDSYVFRSINGSFLSNQVIALDEIADIEPMAKARP